MISPGGSRWTNRIRTWPKKPVFKNGLVFLSPDRRKRDIGAAVSRGDRIGKPPGRPRGSRNALSEAVICAILRDFSKHGEKAIAAVRRRQPAAYLKICALLVPREHKVEHTDTYEGLSTEQIQQYIAAIQDRLDRRAAGHQAKVIDGEAVETSAVETSAVATTTPLVVLEPPKRRSNRLMVEADTAIGPRERKPRKVKLPSPPSG